MTLSSKRVLSIQSHVVHGYVGNKCSQFTLQAHGYETDTINSVQFSNHTAYKVWKGDVMDAEQLAEIYEGLKQNNLNNYTHFLTGYSRSVPFLTFVAHILTDLRRRNANLFYICDPVMGDFGSFYVPENVLPMYRDVLAPMADILTPNQFELQVLSGLVVKQENDILKGMRILNGRGTKRVVVTSTDLSSDENTLFVYCGDFSYGQLAAYRFEIQKFPVVFLGTGDLFASLLLAWFDKEQNLPKAVSSVLSCMHAVLEDTYNYAKARSIDSQKLSFADLELKLISNRHALLEPKYPVQAIEIETAHMKASL